MNKFRMKIAHLLIWIGSITANEIECYTRLIRSYNQHEYHCGLWYYYRIDVIEQIYPEEIKVFHKRNFIKTDIN